MDPAAQKVKRAAVRILLRVIILAGIVAVSGMSI
jgi:hypothetical protein